MKVCTKEERKQAFVDVYQTHGLYGDVPNPSNSGKKSGKNGNYVRKYSKTKRDKGLI